jgi:uncharacterized repeat protein (TIGR01451 family)
LTVPALKRYAPTALAIACVVAGASARGSQGAAAPAVSAACARAETAATIAGKRTCLRAGMKCQKRLDRQYHRYRFHCHSGRLTRPASKPTAAADLAITVSDTPDPVSAGGDLTYTLAISNAGPATAERLHLAAPGGGTVSADPGWSCTSTSALDCMLERLPTGTTTTIRIAVRALTAGALNATFSVGSGVSDPNPANNSASAQTTVLATADVAVSAAASPEPVLVGSNLTYTITVSNAGPSTADNVRVTLAPPAGAVAVASATASQGTCTTATPGECALGAVASGARATATIIVKPNTPGSLLTSASVAATTADPNPGNNSVSVATTVTATAPPPPPRGNCAASYPDICIPPPPPDLDCNQIPYQNFRVIYNVPDPDPHRFDADRDGIGCET